MAKTLVDLDVQAKLASATNQILAANAVTNSKVDAAAAIDFSKLATLTSGNLLIGSALNVATSTPVSGNVTISNLGVTAIGSGVVTDTMLAGSISDGKLATSYIKADGTRAFTGNQAMGGFKITGLNETPTASGDAASKSYVDNRITGLSWKSPVEMKNFVGDMTVADINLLTPTFGDSYVVSDTGTITLGTVVIALAGAIVEYNGTVWVALEPGYGAGYPDGDTRVILSGGAGHTALVGMYAALEGSANGKIFKFTGASLLAVDTGDAAQDASVLVSTDLDPSEVASVYDSTAWVYQGAVPTGAWIQFNGAGQVNAGTGLGKSGNTIYLANTAVTPASLGTTAAKKVSFTVDQQGRLTAAAEADIQIAESQVTNLSTDLSDRTLKATLTAKGSIYGASAASTPAELAVGANGYFLVADSSQTTGLIWQAPAAVITTVTREFPSPGSASGTNAIFALAHTPVAGSESVYLNGMLQDSGAGNDYTISSGTITFASNPTAGSKILVNYRY